MGRTAFGVSNSAMKGSGTERLGHAGLLLTESFFHRLHGLPGCGALVDGDNGSNYENCQDQLCSYCTSTCAMCDDHCYTVCLLDCSDCGNSYCATCMGNCTKCHDHRRLPRLQIGRLLLKTCPHCSHEFAVPAFQLWSSRCPHAIMG